MRIVKVSIKNFRCLQDLELKVDGLTVLIGANSTGKPSTLKALGWFFEGDNLDPEDICGHKADAQVSVGVVFQDLTPADRQALGSYAAGDTATLWRTWSVREGEKLTGHALAYPPFEQIRSYDGAMDRRKAYTQLKNIRPDLGLPSASSRGAVDQAMETWESEAPGELETATSSATHLFGFSGQPKLAGRFDYVFVPAVSDAEEESRHARGTLMQQVLSRSLTNQERVDERLKAIHEDAAERVSVVMEEEHGNELNNLSRRLTDALQTYVPSGTANFKPQPPDLKTSSM